MKLGGYVQVGDRIKITSQSGSKVKVIEVKGQISVFQPSFGRFG